MTREIVKRERARRDLVDTFAYLGGRNLNAAERFLAAVEADLRTLSDMPGLGTRRTSRSPLMQGMRSLPMSGFRNYLLFYVATERAVELVRVMHGARDLRTLLDEE